MAFRRKMCKRRVVRRQPYKRRAYARRARVSPIKRMIRSEISRRTETKCVQQFVASKLLLSSISTSWNVNNVIAISPNPGACAVNQGVGNGSRVGSRVTTKRLTFSGTLLPAAYDATSNPLLIPVQVKMFLLYDRRTPSLAPTPQSDLFQLNNGSSGLLNNLVDMIAPVNTEYYTVLATKQFKLGFASFNGTGSYTPASGFPNNDFKMNGKFRWDVTKYIPKTIVYEGNSSAPTSRGLYCAVVVSNADGSPQNAAKATVQMQYMLDFRFEDA